MAWVKLDDQIPRHPKILAAGPSAAWLWLCSIAHAQSQLSDGFIAKRDFSLVGFSARDGLRYARRLVDVGLFEEVEGGYLVHDYHDHNDSKEEVLTRRAEDRDRKRSGRVSDRNPGGIQPESEGNPGGLARARASRASRPDPTRPGSTSTVQVTSGNGSVSTGAAAAERFRPEEWSNARRIREMRFGCRHEPKHASVDDCLIAIMREVRQKQAATR